MKLEICANSYQSAINAQEAGADRIELCTELSIGGITPSYGLLKKVARNIHIPVHVLIRPRSGNFVYTDNEFTLMKENITLCKKLNVNGIVSGVLKSDNSIILKEQKNSFHFLNPSLLLFIEPLIV
jgi:copper homeostasis protein